MHLLVVVVSVNMTVGQDLAAYYSAAQEKQLLDRYRVNVCEWTDFSQCVSRNLAKSGVTLQQSPSRGVLTVLSDSVESTGDALSLVLRSVEHNIRPFVPDAKFALCSRNSLSIVGGCDSHLELSETLTAMIGLHFAAGCCGEQTERDLVSLAAKLLCLNNLRYAYVTSVTATYFIKRLSSMDRDLTVALSQPVPLDNIVNTLCAMVWQCKYGNSHRLDFKLHVNKPNGFRLPTQFHGLGYELEAISVSEPSVHDIRVNGTTTPGKIKWWKIKMGQARHCYLQLDASKVDMGWHSGLFVDKDSNVEVRVIVKSVVLRHEYSQQLEQLENEATMFELFERLNLDFVPKRHFYGTIMNGVRVLLVGHVGRPLQPEDLKDTCVASQIRHIVAQLHELRILHGHIALQSFNLDPALSKVVIANFGYAKLYRVLYKEFLAREIQQTDALINTCLTTTS